MRLAALAVSLVCLVLLAPADRPVRFIHPKRTFVTGAPGGVDIPVQTLVVRHPDNRAFRLTWDGEQCGGASAASLDGDYARAFQPLEPMPVRVGYGVCGFRAEVFGPGGSLRASAHLDVHVCGDGTACQP